MSISMNKIILLGILLLASVGNGHAQKLKTEYDGKGKVGIVDENGKIIIPIEYYMCSVHDYKLDRPFVEVTDFQRKKAAFSAEGKQLTPFAFDGISFSNTAIIVKKDGKEGIYSTDGREILPCEFKHVSANEEYIYVYKQVNGKELKGLYSLEGKVLVPCEYTSVYPHRTYISVSNDDWTASTSSSGIYSLKGEEVVPCKYSIQYLTKENSRIQMFNIKDQQSVAFVVIGETGEVLVPFNKYQGMEETAVTGLFSVKRDGKWGLWSGNGEIVACQYDNAIKFSNDVATVKKDGEVMLIKNPLKDGSQIQIADAKLPSKKKEKGPAVSRYPKPDSDVDKNIPVAKKEAETTFAFIIANENYPDAPVPYSLNDGRMFREYCQKTLGIPESHINMYEDATFGNIITAVEKMKSIAEAYDGEASVIFYYAGHGFPDDKQATAYLLPIDGDATSITSTGYSLAKLYKEIASLKLKSAVVFLDACFSGAKREDEMLTSARGVAIKVKEDKPQGNMLVFSAAQGDETAHQLEEKHHGLFTYCLLKELQASQGDVDLGTLTDNVTKQVKRQSVVINNKRQTPTAIPSSAFVDSWRNMKLK